MGLDWVIALTSESRFLANGGWSSFPGKLPSTPVEEVIRSLESCGFLHRKGLTFWGGDLEEFTLRPGLVHHLSIMGTHGPNARSEILAICLELARRLGPVTLILANTDERIEVKPTITLQDLLKRIPPWPSSAEGQAHPRGP